MYCVSLYDDEILRHLRAPKYQVVHNVFLRFWSLNASYCVNNGLLLKSTYAACYRTAWYSAGRQAKDKAPLRKANTPQGKFDMDDKKKTNDVFEKFPNDVNPCTKEKGGPTGPEPTRYGDWERKGRCIDF